MKSIFDNLIKKSHPKIFCLSMQRTGTTSVGYFFKNNGFKVADWPMSFKNNWSYYWENGDFETIFNSKDFKNNQVFEDDPWWLPEFYKVLFHRFPDAKFILFTRNTDKWFNSMLSHSEGKILGNTKRHCKVYRREKELFEKIDIPYTKQTQDFLSKSKSGNDDNYYSVYKGKTNKRKWKKELPKYIQNQIKADLKDTRLEKYLD